jgi:hypothetical protein
VACKVTLGTTRRNTTHTFTGIDTIGYGVLTTNRFLNSRLTCRPARSRRISTRSGRARWRTRGSPLDPVFTPVDVRLRTIDAFDVTYSGYGGQRIKGWLLVPRQRQPLPAVVTYIGYGGGRGFPTDWLLWPSAGYAQLVMDTRGPGQRLVTRATHPTRRPTAATRSSPAL